MIINVHAGHNPDGKIACGAVGYIKESTEARRVVSKLIPLLEAKGHTVYNCTVDNGISQNDVLKKIVKKDNSVKAGIGISIHFNALNKKDAGNGKTTGVEVLYKTGNKTAKSYATTICRNISALGYTNRGPKATSSLYYLNKCNNNPILVECCFVNDKDDTDRYNANTMAKAIADAFPTNTKVNNSVSTGIDYSAVFNASYYSSKYPDLLQAFGTDETKLFNHFINNGMKEGRQAIASFNVNTYRNNYKDLNDLFGNNLPLYYKHFCEFGRREGRIAV